LKVKLREPKYDFAEAAKALYMQRQTGIGHTGIATIL